MNIAPKTAAGTGGAAIGGAISVIFLWLLQTIFPRVVVTNEVASAWTVIFSTIAAFVSSYSTHSLYLPTTPAGTSPVTVTLPQSPAATPPKGES